MQLNLIKLIDQALELLPVAEKGFSKFQKNDEFSPVYAQFIKMFAQFNYVFPSVLLIFSKLKVLAGFLEQCATKKKTTKSLNLVQFHQN